MISNPQRDQYTYPIWRCDDDDLPLVPGAEPDPMSSAQSRRAWRAPGPGLKVLVPRA